MMGIMIDPFYSFYLPLIAFSLLIGFYLAWNIGVNDVANAIGTSVGSGTLTLRQAVIMAATMEFCGAFFFGSHVATTMQSGIAPPELFVNDPYLFAYGMLSALLAAGVWLQTASYFGLPVSTTHSIVGGIIGFTILTHGVDSLNWATVVQILLSWVISPVMGAIFSYAIFSLIRRSIFYQRYPMEGVKRTAPKILFVTSLVLSLFFLEEGMKNNMPSWVFGHKIFFSLAIASGFTLLGWLWIRRIAREVDRPIVQKEMPYAKEIVTELDQARDHLKRVYDSAHGTLQYQVANVMGEVEGLSETLRSSSTLHNSEYSGVERVFSFLQVMSASLMAFAHGANDVANAIGPLSAVLTILTTQTLPAHAAISPWLLAFGGVGIVMGLATWGWRVVETIGKKLTELTPSRGFSAEFGAALTTLIASACGMPISTTHTLVGAVLGVACARGIGALNLATTRDIMISWLVTVPAGAVLAMGFFTIFQSIFG